MPDMGKKGTHFQPYSSLLKDSVGELPPETLSRPLLLHQPFPVLPLLMRASAHAYSSPPLFQEGGQNLPILFLLISIFLGRVRWHEALCSPHCQLSPQLVHFFSLSSSRFGVWGFICSPSLTLCLIGKYLVLHNTMTSRGNTIYII